MGVARALGSPIKRPSLRLSSKPAGPVSFYEGIAADALRAFEKDGERWFNKQPAVQLKQ